jgi:hypothetical protein
VEAAWNWLLNTPLAQLQTAFKFVMSQVVRLIAEAPHVLQRATAAVQNSTEPL